MLNLLPLLDRGVSSIVTLLSSLLFNILPCLVDIAVACIFLTQAFDIYFGIIVFITMMCYIYATILMTDWRTRYRRESNALDNAVEARAVDSLLNYETIKLFATEEYEVGKYADAIHAYQKADRKSQYTLGILNTTLNVVIQGGLALGCLLCAKRIAQKEMKVDDFVMYYAYITQLYGPLNLFGTSYRSLQVNTHETVLISYCFYSRMSLGNVLICLMFYCIDHLISIEKLYRYGKDA